MTSFEIQDSRLAVTPEAVAWLPNEQRIRRVEDLVKESVDLLDHAIAVFVLARGKDLKGVCALFSGGNDSTVMTHLFRSRITHAIHANTTIGIEDTRQFVRDTCRLWDIPLLERQPDPVDQYRTLVLERGFPGPGMHQKMYQRLKERAFHKARREIVQNGWRQRVVFLAGRRRTESARRSNVPAFDQDGSIVWVSPMIHWTKLDLNTYRAMNDDVPSNKVADLLHMSGECLCGAFAHTNELDEIATWFPDAAAEIRELEQSIVNRSDIPEYRRSWGWSGDPDVLRASRRSDRRPTSGRLCGTCNRRPSEDQLQITFPA